MNDVIASKGSSLKPKFVVATMFLKLNVSLIPNNLAYYIWNTLIPSLELLDDIDDFDDNEKEDEEEEDNDDDDDDKDDDRSPMPVKSEEADYTC